MAFVQLLVTGDATTEVSAADPLALAGDVTIIGSTKSLTVNDLRLGTIANIQIDGSGDLVQTGSYHSIEANTAADDDLDSISAGSDGQLLFIRAQDDAETITVRHNQTAGAGANILLNADTNYDLDDLDDYMLLIYDAAQDSANGAWTEVSRGQGNVAILASAAPADVGTIAAVGVGTTAARDDHVHDTAIGVIDNNDKFVAAIIENSAIADNAVDTDEINTDAVGNDAIDPTDNLITFNQIIISPNSDGTGTATGTIYYDTEDARLFVFQA